MADSLMVLVVLYKVRNSLKWNVKFSNYIEETLNVFVVISQILVNVGHVMI